jgi:hypothetical protein
MSRPRGETTVHGKVARRIADVRAGIVAPQFHAEARRIAEARNSAQRSLRRTIKDLEVVDGEEKCGSLDCALRAPLGMTTTDAPAVIPSERSESRDLHLSAPPRETAAVVASGGSGQRR